MKAVHIARRAVYIMPRKCELTAAVRSGGRFVSIGLRQGSVRRRTELQSVKICDHEPATSRMLTSSKRRMIPVYDLTPFDLTYGE